LSNIVRGASAVITQLQNPAKAPDRESFSEARQRAGGWPPISARRAFCGRLALHQQASVR
jgi:hypothetical protein